MESISEKPKGILNEILITIAITFVILALLLLFLWGLITVVANGREEDFWRVHHDEVEVRDWIRSVQGSIESWNNTERHITTVSLRNCDITDDDLIRLKRLSRLHTLEISNIDLTDHAIPTIISLNSLNYLTIINTKITFEGLRQITIERPDLAIETDIAPMSLTPESSNISR